MCWLYDDQAALMDSPDANWWQKPGTKPIPVKPAPPTPPTPGEVKPPPPQLVCTGWGATDAWLFSGCGSATAGIGSDCTLVVETFDTADGAATSVALNVLPFQPPKAMNLPVTTVTATVAKPAAATPDQASITLAAPRSAMFVVL